MSTVCPPALKAVAWFGTGVMTRGGRGGLRGALNPEPCVLRTTSPDTDLSGEAAVVTRPGSQGHSHWAVGAEGDRRPPGAGRCQGAFSRGAPRRVPRGNLGFRLPVSRAVRTRFWGFQPSGLVPVAAAAGNSPRLPPPSSAAPRGSTWRQKGCRRFGSPRRQTAQVGGTNRNARMGLCGGEKQTAPWGNVGRHNRACLWGRPPGRAAVSALFQAAAGSSSEAVRGYLGDQGTRAVAPSGALRPRGPTCPDGGERARGPAKRPGRISLCRVRVLLRVTVHG